MHSPSEQIRTNLGQPVFDRRSKQVLAYWAVEKTVPDRLDLMLPMQLLQQPYDAEHASFQLNRRVFLQHWGGTWYASCGTLQKDFAEHPDFTVNPLSGPEARYAALLTLLQDPGFQHHLNAYPGQLDRMRHYLAQLKERARSPV